MRESNEAIVFITHGNFFNELMGVLLEIDRKSGFFLSRHNDYILSKNLEFVFLPHNGSITCFEAKKNGELFLNFFNYHEHLEDLPSKL